MPQWRKLHTKVVESLDFNAIPDEERRISWFHRRNNRAEPEIATIYGLVDPVTNKLRYIGKTHHSPKERLHLHLSEARKGNATPKAVWIRALLDEGKRPKLVILGQYPYAVWAVAERMWIEAAKQEGCDLLNVSLGGGGA